MSPRAPRPSLAETLQTAANAYQTAHVIPHCTACIQPCCRLDTLVLELNWAQVKVFWQLGQSRAAFDKQLAAGSGPGEIRAGNGRYYAHRKACPAYDETQRSCRVYGQPVKPAGCTDFPVYEDGNLVVADLRCEAVDIGVLTNTLARALGPAFRIVQSADRDFPFLISLSARRSGAKQQGRRPTP